MQTIKAIEVTGTAHSFAAANCEADWLMQQDDCYGARVYYNTTRQAVARAEHPRSRQRMEDRGMAAGRNALRFVPYLIDK